jgi:predicted transcriptional regulator
MRLFDVKELIGAEVIACKDNLDMDLNYVFGSDLMSDVLAFVDCDTILLTGLTNIQTVRTAEMMDIKCIIYVRGKTPDEQVIKLANEKGICLMQTKYIMFNACGILYNSGLKGAEIEDGR